MLPAKGGVEVLLVSACAAHADEARSLVVEGAERPIGSAREWRRIVADAEALMGDLARHLGAA